MSAICAKFSVISANLQTFEQSDVPTIHCVNPLFISIFLPIPKKKSSKDGRHIDNFTMIGFESLWNMLLVESLPVVATFLNPRTKSFHFLEKNFADRCIAHSMSQITSELSKYEEETNQTAEDVEADLFAIFPPTWW